MQFRAGEMTRKTANHKKQLQEAKYCDEQIDRENKRYKTDRHRQKITKRLQIKASSKKHKL